jgi:hypothetical protein
MMPSNASSTYSCDPIPRLYPAGKLGSSLRGGPDCRGNVAAAERWRWAAFERWMKRRTSQF